MADVQTYKNHTRWLPAFHFFVAPVLLGNVIVEAVALFRAPSLSTGWAVVVAAALLTIAFLARVMALTAQDRVIRLEMRLRLQGLLPPDLMARFGDLTVSQLVGLRFAGDAEMPELVRTALAGQTTQADIKKSIRQWVPDTYRV